MTVSAFQRWPNILSDGLLPCSQFQRTTDFNISVYSSALAPGRMPMGYLSGDSLGSMVWPDCYQENWCPFYFVLLLILVNIKNSMCFVCFFFI